MKKLGNTQRMGEIVSLEQISTIKHELRAELGKSEEKLGVIWDDMFHQPTEEELASPTQRVMSIITSSAGLIDGALLGWKLYKRFSTGVKLFKGKKKK